VTDRDRYVLCLGTNDTTSLEKQKHDEPEIPAAQHQPMHHRNHMITGLVDRLVNSRPLRTSCTASATCSASPAKLAWGKQQVQNVTNDAIHHPTSRR
jgi:hypothetical protein